MNWRIDYSKDAYTFTTKHQIHDDVTQQLKKFLEIMQGKRSNINIKKLRGKWAGYYRIRKGKLRIIFKVDSKEQTIFIERIDFRGNAYK